jgi:hypothetical protein
MLARGHLVHVLRGGSASRRVRGLERSGQFLALQGHPNLFRGIKAGLESSFQRRYQGPIDGLSWELAAADFEGVQ